MYLVISSVATYKKVIDAKFAVSDTPRLNQDGTLVVYHSLGKVELEPKLIQFLKKVEDNTIKYLTKEQWFNQKDEFGFSDPEEIV